MTDAINTSQPTSPRWFTRRMLLEGVALGVGYGLFFRIMGQLHLLNASSSIVMTMAFLFLGPMVMGILTIRRAAALGQISVWHWIFAPWLTVVICVACALIFYLEGSICVVFAVPFALVGASIGGIVGGLSSRAGKLSAGTTASIAILPLLLAPAESRMKPPNSERAVKSEIIIHASPEAVWHNIERVPPISPAELRTTWAQRVGFPRPIEATLSYEGVGGIRHASFERGVLFIETITAWEPERRLAFSIRADSANIPPTTLDEHVTIGGRYFDVLDGEYRIEPLADGDVLLHLISHQRLSTDFNGYAGFWTDAVMQSLQTSILQVIQHRCEHA